MKTIDELRNTLTFKVSTQTSYIRYFKEHNIDWDVYLPTLGKNLQRGYVWNQKQKEELIWSLFLGRHIPHCALINTINREDENSDKWLVIDGKQRLSTIFGYMDNEFTVSIEGKDYLFNQLPVDYQRCISHCTFNYYVVNEPWEKRITDLEKVAWFKFLNFAGTAQDELHIKSLIK